MTLRGLEIAERIPPALVHINDQTVADVATIPFGGVGASGNGGRLGGARANWRLHETQGSPSAATCPRTRSRFPGTTGGLPAAPARSPPVVNEPFSSVISRAEHVGGPGDYTPGALAPEHTTPATTAHPGQNTPFEIYVPAGAEEEKGSPS